MKIIEQSVSFSRTVQISQYEPVSIFSAIKFETTEDNREKDTEEAFKMVRRDIRKQEDVIRFMKGKGKTGSGVYSPKGLLKNKPETAGDLTREQVVVKEQENYNKLLTK